jgi:F5/8 type C domain/Pectate lyase superfamily protein
MKQAGNFRTTSNKLSLGQKLITRRLLALVFALGTLAQPCFADIQVITPTLNPNEIVVAVTTPQEYGAVGDGTTDDTAAFQKALDSVFHSGHSGGGVVFVPAGTYAFYGNLKIPNGVTLHGDWKDWTTGAGGAVGTTFKVFTTGSADGTPFINVDDSSALRGVNIWYPNQDAANITPYPFTLQVGTDSEVQNVALVNSYQGIISKGPKHILSTVIGTPLLMGIQLDSIADIVHTEDIRFSPDIWSKSGLPGAPLANGPQAAWMRANGTGMRLQRVDGQLNMDTRISGYHVGIEAKKGDSGTAGATFYSGSITHCGTALLAEQMPGALGLMFANMTLDGDIAVNRTDTTSAANVLFSHCTIIGRHGTAVSMNGNGSQSWMQFQSCSITGTLQLNQGVFNAVNCALSGSPQCKIGVQATMASFTGCTFSPSKNIVNQGLGSLLVDNRPSSSPAMPILPWATVKSNYLTRKPARADLFVATTYGATGDGVTDDTAAIQSALDAAKTNGGGIVYLPGGKYKLTTTLTVPGGVELRGPYEMRHRTWPASDGKIKGAVLQPYGGQGSTTGPVAIALEANSGLVGVTISYESQTNAGLPFPATIQGRGANVYVIGVQCPNPYWYVDMDTYKCVNHFIYMVDGWCINMGFNIGHDSSGTVVDCQGNWTYWIDNYGSASCLSGKNTKGLLDSVYHHSTGFQLGQCTETLVKSFNIIECDFMHFVTENGHGPDATLIGCYCDASIKGMVLDSAADSTISAVNTPMCIFDDNGYADLKQATVGVLSTPNFQGTARFFNTTLFASPYWDFDINGGDVGLEGVHMNGHSYLGSRVNAGVFHLVNGSSNGATGGPNDHPPYHVAFGTKAGMAGKTSEFIGNYTQSGCTYDNSSSDPVNAWGNFALDGSTIVGNIALHCPVTASSSADGLAASNAVDGNPGTRWSSDSSDNQWIYVDLGSMVNLSGVRLVWENAYGKSYKIQVSPDASTWTDVYSTTTGTGGIYNIVFSASGRYVRMLGIQRGTAYGYSLWEFQIFADATGP